MAKSATSGQAVAAAPAKPAVNIKLVIAVVLFIVAGVLAYLQWPRTLPPGTELPPAGPADQAAAGEQADQGSKTTTKYTRTDRDTVIVQEGEVTVERAGGGVVAPGSGPN
ncbi:MAG: hypothetical protein AMXMBFR58_04560 [Phycisphaerae bacterium]|nr:hypothetical protein [Phycisphaerales bacterium]